jgi:hypothetical protein
MWHRRCENLKSYIFGYDRRIIRTIVEFLRSIAADMFM